MLAASLALTTFLPAYPVFAAEEPVPAEESTTPTEEVSAPAKEIASPEESAVEAETNVDYLNYLELEDYLITAERIPTNKWETPANVTVITAKEIEENHYQNLGEALSHVNGLYVRITNSPTNGHPFINSGERVLLLINGHRATDTQSNMDTEAKAEYTLLPSMKMIERIEIFKGGGSALYGTDAVDGVINIITKKGTQNETTIDLNTGTWRRHNYEITNQGVAGNLTWFITGSLNKSHAWDYRNSTGRNKIITDPGFNMFEAWSNYSDNGLSIRLDNRFDDRNSLTADFMHRSDHHFGYSYTDSRTFYSDIYNSFSFSYNFKESTSTPGWLRYFNSYKAGHERRTGGYAYARIQGIDYQNGWELGQHKIIAGFEWNQNKVRTDDSSIRDRKSSNTAFYLQDTISLGEKWKLIPGARYDHSKDFGGNWSPKIAANYRPDEKTKIYASWGRVYRAPNIAELYTDIDHLYLGSTTQGSVMYDGKYLRPEKGHTETIGIEHNFDDNTNISLNLFHSKLRDPIRWYDTYYTILDPYLALNVWYFGYPWAQDEDGNYLFAYNHPTNSSIVEKRKGLELNFSQKVNDHFSYNLGYSHIKSENSQYQNSQPNGYRVGLSYRNRGLKANLHGIMASGLDLGHEGFVGYPSKRYAIFDLNLSYDVNDNLTFYFKALNFTNQRFSHHSKANIYPGRSFIYGMNYKF